MLLAGLLGCSHTPPVKLNPEEPLQVELSSVPFFPQRRKQCGAASLATVLAYYQGGISAESLEDSLYIPGREGTLAVEIVAQARQHGMLAYPLEPDLNALLNEVRAGHPVLVLQNLGLSWLPQWHFAVVVGFDLQTRDIILRSGNDKRRVVALNTFLSTWQRSQRWALVITPPSRIAASAKPLNFLKAAADLEQVGQLGSAAVAYEAALRNWADHPRVNEIANLGLANIAFRHQNYAAAQLALIKAIATNAMSASSWNNLSFVLLEQGCYQEASLAVACAVRLKPEDPGIQGSYREIRDLVVEREREKNQSDQCQSPRCPL